MNHCFECGGIGWVLEGICMDAVQKVECYECKGEGYIYEEDEEYETT